MERRPKTVLAFHDDVLLRNWKYYLQGLPYTSLVDLLKDAVRMGLNVTPYHRLEKKRKWYDELRDYAQKQNKIAILTLRKPRAKSRIAVVDFDFLIAMLKGAGLLQDA